MKKSFVMLGIVGLVVFALFSREIKQGAMRSVDFAVTVKLQERIDNSSRLRLARAVGEVMEGSTFFASPGVSVVLVLALTAWAGIDWKRRRIRLQSAIIPLAFFFLVLGEMYGKSVVHHPAPPFYMIKNPTTVFPKYYINDEFSYPSGHAARAVFMAIISYSLFIISREAGSGSARHYSLFKRKSLNVLIAIGLLVYVSLVSISRIYLGHHWLSDILGGGMLGVGFAFLSLVIL